MDIIIIISDFRKYSSFSILHPLHFSRPILGGMGECNGDTITKRDGINIYKYPPNYTRSIVTASIGIPVAKEEKVGEENNENEEKSSEAPDFYNHRAFFKSGIAR